MAGVAAMNYASALFELAKEENQVEAYKEQLKEIVQTLQSSRELQDVLAHPKIEKEDKKEIARQVFEAKGMVGNFLMLLLDKNRFSLIEDITQAYTKLANKELGIEVCRCVSAVELSEKQRADLTAMLRKKTGKRIELNCYVDASCLAGIRIQVGNVVLDNTMERKLEQIKESVAKATWIS